MWYAVEELDVVSAAGAVAGAGETVCRLDVGPLVGQVVAAMPGSASAVVVAQVVHELQVQIAVLAAQTAAHAASLRTASEWYSAAQTTTHGSLVVAGAAVDLGQ